MIKNLKTLYDELMPKHSSNKLDSTGAPGYDYREKKRFKEKSESQQGFNFLSLIRSWEEIVGAKMATHTIPLKINRDCLYLLSDHSAYSQSISFLQNKIIAKIHERYPTLSNKIKRISFIQNASYFKKQKEVNKNRVPPIKKHSETAGLHPYSPEYINLKEEAEKQFADFSDPEMRKKLISLYIQSKLKEKR